MIPIAFTVDQDMFGFEHVTVGNFIRRNGGHTFRLLATCKYTYKPHICSYNWLHAYALGC